MADYGHSGVTHVTALVDMVRLLEAGGTANAPDVANRYGVSLRTAERWLNEVDRWVPTDQWRDPRDGMHGRIHRRKLRV